MEKKPLKEELTTAMHSEFMEGEISQFDMRVMGVYGATVRGVPLADALAKYKMTAAVYLANVDRVLNS